MSRLITATVLILIIIAALAAPAAALEPNYTSLVYPGQDGKLVYVPDENGNTIPDFSNAGYEGGGVAIPDVPVKVTVKPGEGDDSFPIQDAIDRVEAMPRDENGFRGAVLLKAGTYELMRPIYIHADGVVLRGEGNGPQGTTLTGLGAFGIREAGCSVMYTANMIIVRGMAGAEEVPGSAVRITDDYVPCGARSFKVASAKGFKPGDTVIVRRHGNHDWIHFVNMDNDVDDVNKVPEANHDHDRVIVAVKGNTITIDAPIVAPIETRWGGGELIKYTDARRIDHVGIENIRGVSGYDPTVKTTVYLQTTLTGPEYLCDEDHYWNFIFMDNVKNSWVRNATALHFVRSCVQLGSGAKWVTLQDSDAWEYVSVLAGCRRSAFGMDGQCCLTQRCKTDMGRHDWYIGGTYTCGPNVFLDCVSGQAYSSSEPHGTWDIGMLYDNVKAPITLRFYKRARYVWTAFSTNWNCTGYYLVQKPPAAQNYAFGQFGEYDMIHNRPLMDFTLEPGHIESAGKRVDPRSLYLKQLEDRLGPAALKNIGY